MPNLGTPELILILAVVIILFGVGRIGRIGGELGSAVRSFREGLAGSGAYDENKDKDNPVKPE
jgi:sec-independent protein translocase protein TatA